MLFNLSNLRKTSGSLEQLYIPSSPRNPWFQLANRSGVVLCRSVMSAFADIFSPVVMPSRTDRDPRPAADSALAANFMREISQMGALVDLGDQYLRKKNQGFVAHGFVGSFLLSDTLIVSAPDLAGRRAAQPGRHSKSFFSDDFLVRVYTLDFNILDE